MSKVIWQTASLGSAGGAATAACSQADLAALHGKIEAYLDTAQKEGRITIAEATAEAFRATLRDTVIGSRENWNATVANVAQFGSGSAAMMATIVRNHLQELPKLLRGFIEAQAAAGAITIDSAQKTAFMTGLAGVAAPANAVGKA